MEKLSETEEDKKDSMWTSLLGFFIIALGVIAIWLANWFLMLWRFGSPDSVGTAGDLFGAATSLFSGLAFAGLISTLLMQRRELELQRRQLKLQNNELKDTRKEFQIQRFESRFFGMLKLLNDHIATFEHVGSKTFNGDPRRVTSGKSVLLIWLPKLLDVNTSKLIELEFMIQKFNSGLSHYEPELGPYFRLLFSIVHQLDKTEFSENPEIDLASKKSYASIIISQLSTPELTLIFLLGLTENGSFAKEMICKYSLLENFPYNLRKTCGKAILNYDPAAFGDRAHLFFDDIEEPQAQ